MRRLLVAFLALIPLTGCIAPLSPSATPQNPTYGCVYADEIRNVWQQDADWAIHIAMRESGCDQSAYNRSGASGVFQLLNHGDLLAAVCLDADPFLADCNIRAAWLLYQGSGRSPWNL